MKKLTMKHEKITKKVATPVGRLLWMNLANPTPVNAVMQPDKYTCTVAFDPKDETQKVAIKGLFDAILEVARTAYGDDTITLQDLKDNNCLSVVKDGALMKDYLAGLLVTGSSTSSKFPPKVYGPVMSQGEMSKEDIARINNGDYGRMVVTISSYKTPAKHGITSYLSVVQFARKGEYLGGKGDGSSLLSDLDVEGVTEDEKALLETIPMQDKEEPRAEREVTPVKKETKKTTPAKEESAEPVSDDSFNDLFNF